MPNAFDHTWCVRTHSLSHAGSSGRTQAQSALVSRGNPSQPWWLFAVDCMPYVRPQITGAFERTTCVRTHDLRSNVARDLSAYKKDPRSILSRVFTLGVFLRAVCHYRPCSTFFLCNLSFYLILMLCFSFFTLPYHMGG
jgi:hypothetical protein